MRHEQFPIEPVGARGAASRARLTLICEIRQGSQPWRMARLTDLSETGFRLSWLPGYDAGKTMRVRIHGMEPLAARVCWRKGRQLGCEFIKPLHVAVFEHVVRAANGEFEA